VNPLRYWPNPLSPYFWGEVFYSIFLLAADKQKPATDRSAQKHSAIVDKTRPIPTR